MSKQENSIKLIELNRGLGKKIVLAKGCFDLIHIGHKKFLENIKKAENEFLVVAVNSDKIIKERKGKDRPVIQEEYRAEMVGGLRVVDLAFVTETNNIIEIISKIQPDIVVIPIEQTRIEEMESVVKTLISSFPNLEIRRVPYVQNVPNTSKIIDKIKS